MRPSAGGQRNDMGHTPYPMTDLALHASAHAPAISVQTAEVDGLPAPIPDLADDCDPRISEAHELVLLWPGQIYVDLPQLEATILRRKPATVLKYLAVPA